MSRIQLSSALFYGGLVCLVLLGLLGAATSVAGTATAGPTTAALHGQSRAQAANTLFLPVVSNRHPAPQTTFGVQMASIRYPQIVDQAAQAGVSWVRYNAFEWDRIEPQRTSPATYHWGTVDETSLRTAHDQGFTVIAEILFAPAWAQKYPGSPCGPIAADRVDEYTDFVSALVKRYKNPPYGIKYWELGNEPDMTVVYERRGYGCWGEPSQPYFGGQYYGQVLKAAARAIKAADPQAQVLIGGLLLDCDPDHPPAGADCRSAHFFEGILRAGAGDAFDFVSYHGYAYYVNGKIVDEEHPNWAQRGGNVLGKARFLRQTMAKYNVDKPLMHTEASLLYPVTSSGVVSPPGAAFFETQADYVVRLYARNWANGIRQTTWYLFEGPGWRYGSLLDGLQDPKPAYHAYRFMTQALAHATYEGPVTRYPSLEGYSWLKEGKRVEVLWPPQQGTVTIALPADVIRVYNKYGTEIAPQGGSLALNSPVYIERPR